MKHLISLFSLLTVISYFPGASFAAYPGECKVTIFSCYTQPKKYDGYITPDWYISEGKLKYSPADVYAMEGTTKYCCQIEHLFYERDKWNVYSNCKPSGPGCRCTLQKGEGLEVSDLFEWRLNHDCGDVKPDPIKAFGLPCENEKCCSETNWGN